MREYRAFFLVALLLLLVSACSRDPAPGIPELKVGTVREALSSNPSPCLAGPTTCTLYPDRDTTVYSAVAKDYGKAHELCIGLTSGLSTNGIARALLHFNLGALPAKSIVTAAQLNIFARRAGGDTGTLDLYRLTSGSFFEGDGTGLADGHTGNAGCPGCTGSGACGWTGAGTFNSATYGETNNVGAKVSSSPFTVAAGVTTAIHFLNLASDVRSQASGSNIGWTLRANNEALAASRVVVWSTDTGTDANKPGLQLDYSKGPGSACTLSSECVFSNGNSGVCAGGFCCSATCDDGKSCTTDACNSSGTCTNTNNNAACNDSKSCTTDTCNPASGSANFFTGCVITAVDANCNDSKTCTTDTCNPASGAANVTTGCVNAANNGACNDNKSCTTDTCNPASGAANASTGCVNANVDANCNDSKSCTTDVCNPANGSANFFTGCVITTVDANCNDSNVCTNDVCNPSSGAASPTTGCVLTNNSSPCDDLTFCNGTDTCGGGSCSLHSGNPCPANTTDSNCATSCNEAADLCNAADPNGTGCDDGTFCNGSDTCTGGSCSSHGGNPCPVNTTDSNCATSCNEAADLCNAADPNGTGCNDGTFCNGSDTCNGGSCSSHAGNPCPVVTTDSNCATSCNEAGAACNLADPNGTGCNDGTFCNGSDTCNGGSCSSHAGNPCPVVTTDSNCATSCNEAGAACNLADPNGTGCNDGTFCNGSDTCNGGSCSSHAGNPCPVVTTDSNCATSCNEAGAACNLADPNGTGCSDGTFCNGNDTCNGGTCSGHAGNPCTVNTTDANCATSCNEGGAACNAADPNGTGCNDGTFCNGNDTCSGGVCSNHAGDPCLPLNTSDSNCAGSCNEAGKACSLTDPNGTGCNDGTFCNGTDSCNAGACTTHLGNPCLPLNTSDGNCAGSCNEAGAACNLADPNGTGCNDGTFCNGTDTCSAGACSGHTGNPCPVVTTDANCSTSCNEAGAACNLADPNGTGCNDGTFCNGSDTCNGGSCSSHAGNPCPLVTTDANCSTSCNEGSAACNAADPNGTGCNDGTFCNGSDTCNGGACSSHAGNPCAVNTTDANCATSCNEGGAACNLADPNGTGCNDGTFCNGSDTCNGGACSSHGGNPCLPLNTTDANCNGSCNEVSDNCTAADPNLTSCNDALTCTSGEACHGGVCNGGGALDCSASADQCHAGVCSEPGGCAANALTGNSCNDGNACTTGDTCQSGTCTGGAAPNCNDNNPCTTDSCSSGTGCTNTPVSDGTACGSDGNACTLDTCVAGTCHTPVANGTSCGAAPSCSGNIPSAQSIPAVTCSGGVCPAQNPAPCGATTPCNGTLTACQGNCGQDSDCPGGFFCNAGTNKCVAQVGAGAGCTRTAMCTQAGPALTCVDSVCCTSTCGGGVATDCQTCNGASPGTCTTLSGTSCDDNTFCNGTDTCSSGACTLHAGNPCLPLNVADGSCAGSCNEAADNCTAPDPDSTACNDGLFCTVGERCLSGLCAGSSARDCSAFTDQCNTGTCNAGTNACVAQPVSNTSCNDGNACTTTDQCNGGTCQGGAPPNCNDANPCTTDSCAPASGCAHTNLADNTPCTNDGHFCTYDVCRSGQCNLPVAASDNLGCRNASCTGSVPAAQQTASATCNGVLPDCPAAVISACGATTPCDATSTACQGGCTTDAQCPGGFFCNTATSKCAPQVTAGAGCARTAMCSQAGPALACVDSVCCTSACGGGIATDCQTCNGVTPGTCTGLTGTVCDDGVFCNGTDTCAAGTCTIHGVSPCPGPDGDGNCAESCNEGAKSCSAPDPNGSACDDGLFCTVSEKCQSGVCGGGSARDCSASGDQCNTGACVEASAKCVAQPLTGNTCNDGNACTGTDKCAGGACSGTAVNCNDNNPCTDDSCTPQGGCIHTNNTAACDDANACTGNDRCNGAGACAGGAAVTCNDNNPCTNDTCATGTGCVFTNSNSNPCSDGDACTSGDHCSAGACVGAGATSCDDGNPCTDDSCSPAGGCAHAANTASCDDGNKCTTNDVCAAKACKGGAALACSDGNPCTDDSCSPATGCVFTKDDTNGCNDANACTSGDHCTAGACAGATVVCNDSNPCTDDSCDTLTGCIFANNSNACNDGNACTTADACAGGTCVGGSPPTCNDGNPCTQDGCDPTKGCVFPAGHAGTPCRASAGLCDLPESCDGTNPNCPSDQLDRSTVCSPPSCSGGSETNAGICNGSGASCPTPTQKACAPFTCGTVSCLSTCNQDADCAPGNYCAAGGNCTPKGALGAVCSAGVQCLSSFCADGVCCNGVCGSQCEACNLPTSEGTCTPVTGKPVGSRPACPGDGTGCDGSCNGTVTTSCTVPGQTVECRTASCDATTSTATLREFCDGLGSCPLTRTQDCTPGICGATQCAGCSTNADCPTGDFCRGGVCKPLTKNGVACSIDAECQTGHCVDRVCCDNDCTGQCESCNLPQLAGTCTAIAKDQPPAAGRPPCSGTGGKCGGACDGANRRSCVYPGLGVSCHDAACQRGVASLIAFCDGAGACPPADQLTCPSGSACVGTICAGGANSCTADGDCNSDQYCAAGVCVGKKAPGATCNTASECASSVCVDNVCCTKPCTGQCEACNLVGSEGTCLPVSGAPRGSRQPCTTDGSTCGGSCDGVATDRCGYKGAETSCRPGQCAGGLADLAATCQGNGSCAPLQQQSCDPVGCDGADVKCAGPCAANADCTTTQYCSAGMCVGKLGDGAPCGSPSQCTNGHCVDGVCCNATCDGECQSCDQAGSLGTCITVPGSPRNGRPACAGSGACGGFCDGTNATACALPGATVACGVEFCASGSDTTAPKCNGAATCVIPAPTSCDPYRCDDLGQACLTTCVLDADCASGLVCIDSVCSQPIAPVPDAGVDAGRDAGPGAAGTSAGGARSPDAGTSATGAKSGSGGRGGAGGAAGSSAGRAPEAGGAMSSFDAGAGGIPTADAGASRDGGPGARSGDTGSCGCRVPGSGQRDPDAPLFAMLAAVALARLRRRGSRERGATP